MTAQVWLLVFAIAEIVLATAVLIYFIRRSKTRPCRGCGRRVQRGVEACPHCGRRFR